MDAECGGGGVCHSCECENPSACDSGIGMLRPALRVRATPFSLVMSGRAIIPKPWQGVNPVLNGVRVRVDAVSGPGGVSGVVRFVQVGADDNDRPQISLTRRYPSAVPPKTTIRALTGS